MRVVEHPNALKISIYALCGRLGVDNF